MKNVRIWLEDTVEPNGGVWCYGIVNEKGYFVENNSKENESELDFIERYIEWGYKVEYLK